MQNKRPRGRPKGTEINDGRYLDQVADLMVKDRSLKKTPAIARIVEKNFSPHEYSKMERRLLRKWNKTSTERLAAARERQADARNSVSHSGGSVQIGSVIAAMESSLGIGHALRAMQPSVLGSIGAAMSHQDQIGKIAKQMDDLINPPGLRVLQEQEQMMQRYRDIIDPPYLRQMREQEESMQRILRASGIF